MTRPSAKKQRLTAISRAYRTQPIPLLYTVPEAEEDYMCLSSDDDESEDDEREEDMDSQERRAGIIKRLTDITEMRWKEGAHEYIKTSNRNGPGTSRRTIGRKTIKIKEDDVDIRT
jgi:hypothetical protein